MSQRLPPTDLSGIMRGEKERAVSERESPKVGEAKKTKSKVRLAAERELKVIRLRYPTGSPAREALIKECRERYRRRGIIV